jgi:nucleoside-diphosphate-sugar epimerase
MSAEARKVLILGASGFVGSRLCEALCQLGSFRIVPLVRTMGRAARIGRLGIEIFQGDATDEGRLRQLFPDIDIVVNLIAGSDAITHGTRLTARLAREYGVSRYVHVSTAAVYGIVAHEGCVDESAPLKRTGFPYCDAKLEAELILRKEAGRGLGVTMLRPRVIWGPYSSWVLPFFQEVVSSRRHTLIDEGRGVCNSIFIDNLVDAILWAFTAQVPSGAAFFVRDVEELTWRDYYHSLATMLPYPISFETIDRDALRRLLWETSRARSIPPLRRLLRQAVPAGAIQLKRIPPVRRYVGGLSEVRKVKIKRALGMSWPERESSHPVANESSPAGLPDGARLLRETGLGRSRTARIAEAGWQAPFSYEEGMARTRAWLVAARVIEPEVASRAEADLS